MELLGFSVEEWRSDPDLWKRQLHPDDRERIMQAHETSNELGERFLEEYRFTTKDGREVWIRDEAVPVRNADRTLLYWRGVMLDITDRKQAEEKLRWSLEVLATHVAAAARARGSGSRPLKRRSAAGSPPTSTTIRSR